MKKTLCFIAVLALTVLIAGCQPEVGGGGNARCRTLADGGCACSSDRPYYWPYESSEALHEIWSADGRYSAWNDAYGLPDNGIYYYIHGPVFGWIGIVEPGQWIPSIFTKTPPLVDNEGSIICRQWFDIEKGIWVLGLPVLK